MVDGFSIYVLSRQDLGLVKTGLSPSIYIYICSHSLAVVVFKVDIKVGYRREMEYGSDRK